DLPGAIHLVAEAPELDVPGLLAAILAPEVAPIAAARMVDILDEVARRIEAARAEVDRQHHLGTGGVAPVGEFMNADLIALRGMPGEVEPHRALLLRPDAVFPVIGGDEIAARVAH